MEKWEALGLSKFPSTITMASHHKSHALLSHGTQHSFNSILRNLRISILCHMNMAHEGSRNSLANRDLQRAQDSYETRTSLKEKHKIEELEAIVVEEEEHL